MENNYPKDIRKWAQDLADQLADHISNLDLSDYFMGGGKQYDNK